MPNIRQVLATRHSIVSLFLKRFTLNEEDKEAITSREVPVDKRFFDAMDKAERIRGDCRVLMVGEEGSTKAGYVPSQLLHLQSLKQTECLCILLAIRTDIMQATSSYLEQAYEKMFRFCCFEFRQLGRDALTDVPPALCEAVRRLRERPELLTYVVPACPYSPALTPRTL